MKTRIILTLALLFLLGHTAPAQSLAGKKFCLDPGHAGTANAVSPDPGIWLYEAWTNWYVAGYLKAMLEAEGATVYLTKNDQASDPSLSARYTVANTYNVDWFHSIHSNAVGSVNNGTNYTMVLIKEDKTTRQAVWPQAITMSGYQYQQMRAKWRTASSSGNSGTAGVYLDYTFYGGPTGGGFNLGVLNGAAMPCELSEAAFHDYYPQTRRMLNNNYLKMEAYALRDAFRQYYGLAPDAKSMIAGLQTDWYSNAPVNNTTVRLMPGNRVYSGDTFNNGFFLFDSLDAGTYTVRFETPGYRPDSVTVTLAASSLSFQDRRLRPWGTDTIPPVLASVDPPNGNMNVLPNHPVSVTFSKMMENAGLETGIVIKEEGVVQTRFATYTGTLNLRGNTYWPRILPAPIRLKAGKNYSVEISGVTDIAGNVLQTPVTVNFRVTNDAFSATLLEALNPDLSAWMQPDSSLYTTGVIPESTAVTGVATPCLASYASLPGAGSGSGALSYVWDTTAAGLIDFPLVSGPARNVQWRKENHVLQIALHGDASGTLFRFGVEDSTDLGVVKQEVSPWKKIDWYGWRFVDWDMRTEAPGMWTGTGSLDGTLRFSRLQFARETGGSARSGRIYVDQLQLVEAIRHLLVYPGDANNDGIVDARDILSIRQFITVTGASRPGGTVAWSGQDILSTWLPPEAAYADCDGNGIVDVNDVVAIITNWGNTVGSPAGNPDRRFACEELLKMIDAQGIPAGPMLQIRNAVVQYMTSTLGVVLNFSLEQNWPNPFNPRTNIRFTVPEDNIKVTLTVFNVVGQVVWEKDFGPLFTGSHTVTWDARSNDGLKAASGMYVCQMRAGSFLQTKKMLVLK